MYEYKVKVTRVVDGDTVDADINLGFDIVYKERIRLMGIDTPESRTRNKKEKKLGLEAKARLKELCKMFKNNLVIKTSKDGKGKFGRVLGELVTEDNVNLNGLLIEEGHARPYMGGSKGEPWTKSEGDDWYRWTSNGYKLMEE